MLRIIHAHGTATTQNINANPPTHVLASQQKGDRTVATTRAKNAGQQVRIVRMAAIISAAREAQKKSAQWCCFYELSVFTFFSHSSTTLYGMHPNWVYNTERHVPTRITRLTSVGVSNRVRFTT